MIGIAAIAVSVTAAMADGTATDGAAPNEAGQRHFLRCIACHNMGAQDEPARIGPHLEAIVGRPAAAVEGYAYTDAVRALDFTWDEERLDRWLEQPQPMVPGMCLPFMGLPDPGDRRALIDYMAAPRP